MTREGCARADLERWFAAGVAAVSADRCLGEAVARAGAEVRIAGERLDPDARVFVLGLGKAGAALAGVAVETLGDRVADGFVLVPDGCGRSVPRCRVHEAAHPLPDERGVAATERLLDWIATPRARDCLLVLLSGGASSLLSAPAPGLRLSDLSATSDALLRGGAPIDALNAVRKHLSRATGGQLARRAGAGRIEVLAVSDVDGDRLDVLASGPFAADPTTYADALGVLEAFGATSRVSDPVRAHLERGARGEVPDTPGAGDPAFRRVRHTVVANNARAIAAVAASARREGFRVEVVSDRLAGEARHAGRRLGGLARACAGEGPLLLLAGGETVVEVRGSGRGGRSQELALSAAAEIAGAPRWSLLAAGTDGIDGPTDAAGAFVDSGTRERGREVGLDLEAALADNDAYAYFEREGGLLRTGPTGTNVRDLVLVRRDASR